MTLMRISTPTEGTVTLLGISEADITAIREGLMPVLDVEPLGLGKGRLLRFLGEQDDIERNVFTACLDGRTPFPEIP
jgi:hypothetical protein